MAVKVGDVVGPARESVPGLNPEEHYVVIGYAREGGFWLQSLSTGEMPTQRKTVRKRVNFGSENVAVTAGFMPKELRVVGRYDYGLAA